ncbi:MAG TPA: hypothetical protein DIU15_15280 [Deltaproteobacteria bacterium]|nr:hypothetical protein [Deltaproteobacteria bacterium]HCP47403.1 hypothetical protein [Deltaproteobacteria bacterium]
MPRAGSRGSCSRAPANPIYDRDMATVTFLPAGVTVEVRDGTTVFHAADRAEVAIPSQCGGKCACALCRVKVVDGDDAVSPMRWEEEGHLGNCYHLTRERLSCQLQVFGKVVIEVLPDDSAEKPKSRYIPYSLVRKREKMERDEELRLVRGNRGRTKSRSKKPKKGGPGEGGEATGRGSGSSTAEAHKNAGRKAPENEGGTKLPSRGRSSRRRRGRKRTTGSLRPGDTRPPEGARKKG